MMKSLLLISASFWITAQGFGQQAVDYAVPLRATQVSASAVVLNWPADTAGSGYRVFAKAKGQQNWGVPLTTLPANASAFTDAGLSLGVAKEYYVQRIYANPNRLAHGYIYVANQLPAVHSRGAILVLIDSAYVQPLGVEVNRFLEDLLLDGWIVESQMVSRSESVLQVKQKVMSSMLRSNRSAPLKALCLLGHIPVPYSGGFRAEPGFVYPPDGHNDHGGAWATDMYYASMNENFWTDAETNDLSPVRTQNKNIPGDLKFDQMFIGEDTLALQVGRIDVTQLPALGQNDTVLMKRYLDKNHAFKSGVLLTNRRGLIDDHWGALNGEAFAAMAWRDFSTMFGDSVFAGDYLTETKKANYLFTWGGGPGSYNNAQGVASTAQFTNDSIQQIFTVLFGSYFGDFDSENNLLRAPLGSVNGGLASFWSGRPHWHTHHMALGENIGFSTLLSQNNFFENGVEPAGYVHNSNPTFIHINLMGDPTLRLHPRKGVNVLQAVSAPDSLTVNLSWSAAPGATGYVISKASNLSGGFVQAATTDAPATSWTDPSPYFGWSQYMVRPIYLESTPSGTYLNTGHGRIDSAYSVNTTGVATVQRTIPIITMFPNPAQDAVELISNETMLTVTLYSIEGKEVLHEHLNAVQGKLNLAHLPKGYYFARIHTTQSQVVQKLIIQ